MNMALPPALILLLGAALLPLLPAAAKRLVVLTFPIFTLIAIWAVADGAVLTISIAQWEIVLLQGSALSRLFATIFALMAAVGGWYALGRASTLELSAALLYAGSSIGVVFSGDLLSLFIFWELMAIGSSLVIFSANTEQSYRAGMRYLLVHLLGGVVLMAGIVAWFALNGDLSIVNMTAALQAGDGNTIAAGLILAGILLNAGAPPFSAWLPDAYPEASPSGMVFLSAFTTKTAVFVLIQTFAGAQILIWIGLYMVFYGIIYALLENDMRRILAYSIINQVGFMVTGIGIGTALALNGAAAHAFTHIIYKALLLMSAGAVLYRTGQRKCTSLGGLFQTMPITALCGIIGALAISSFPLTSGFISKSMISQSAADQHLTFVWMALAAASAGVFLHAGIKFPWFVFFQKDSGLRPKEAPIGMLIPMIVFAALCLLLGIFPEPLYKLLPFDASYVPYTGAHVVAQLQLLIFAGLAFFVLLPLMRRTLTLSLDFDWTYRRFLPCIIGMLKRVIVSVDNGFRTWFLGHLVSRLESLKRAFGPLSAAAISWDSARMALIALLAIGTVLLIMVI